MGRILALLIVLWSSGNPAWSQGRQTPPSTDHPLNVALYLEPPFVTKTADGYGGFCVELWEGLANKAGWKWTYVEVPDLNALINSVATGKADIAITNISITKERLELADFTLPYFDTGYQIMIDSKRPHPASNLWQGLEEDGHVNVIMGAAIAILVLSFLLTIIDRHFDPEFHRAWTHGWAESFYHVMSLIFTGKASHRGIPGPVGKILAGIWIVCGVALISYITAGFTSVLTANRIHGQIAGPQNLTDKTVGTLSGSSAEAYCHLMRWDTQPFETLELAVQALIKKEVDAIVFDSPTLTAYDRAHPELPIKEVGPVFQPRKYGFALSPGNPILHTLNLEIAAMLEDGRMDSLKNKYFGTD